MSFSPCVYNRKHVCCKSHCMNMTDSGCDVILPVALLNASAYVVCGDA